MSHCWVNAQKWHSCILQSCIWYKTVDFECIPFQDDENRLKDSHSQWKTVKSMILLYYLLLETLVRIGVLFSSLQWNFLLLQHIVWEHQKIPEEIHFRGRRKYTFQSNFSFDSIVRVYVCRLLKLSRVSQCISPDSSFLWKDRRAKIRSKRLDNNSTRAPTNCYNRTLSFSVFLPVRIAVLCLSPVAYCRSLS